ncbi:UvrD-helicase domain-containing protein [Corynebacterium aquilae]|uniref:DNA 3'-5' helicase n=1 Tax=Corynebacterium aquilae DSM 44791 TaxID=1431546 RepID=A0A1L7CHA1_9CORY|nr:UvrD-helicase domain-containing protein [Corynebacterium aquilae]APT85242.1 hypothetical protein CAQU_09345 [Corynebacterium aquilae DSM 44791]
MTTSAPTLSDHSARDSITHETDTTLFVEAGAGSGKTHHLVERLITLIVDDGVPIEAIAAITFTNKAADELTDRLHRALSSIAADGQLVSPHADQPRTFSDPQQARARARRAVENLPGAAIETLHAFCQRILTRYPLEAHIPPTFTVADGFQPRPGLSVIDTLIHHATEARTDEHGSTIYDDSGEVCYAHNENIDTALRFLLGQGVSPRALKKFENFLAERWSELAHLTPSREPEPTPFTDEFLQQRIGALRVLAEAKKDPTVTDPLNDVIVSLTEFLNHALSLNVASRATLAWPKPSGLKKLGTAAQWNGITKVRQGISEQIDLISQRAAGFQRQALAVLRDELITQVPQAARDRITRGDLQYHDLLFLVDDMLQRDASVAAALHQQYQRILIDEFQDTDPVQLRIATAITKDPHSQQPVAGSLFTVGDPKQAIYRFRDADIDTYLAARTELGANTKTLSTNFRSAPAVLDWVNEFFDHWLHTINTSTTNPDSPAPQVEFQPLNPRPGASNDGYGAWAIVAKTPGTAAQTNSRGTIVGCPDVAPSGGSGAAHLTIAHTIRALATGDVSAFAGLPEVEPCPLDDIVVLVAAHQKARDLMRLLGSLNIPYQSEGSTLAYAGAEVEALHCVLYAIAHPDNAFGIAASLRSPLFGISDTQLAEYSYAHPDFPFTTPPPDEDHSLVADALRTLTRLRQDTRGMDTGEIVSFVTRELQVRAVACAMENYADDALRRIDFVLAQARAFADNTQGSLRSYLQWVDSIHNPDVSVPVETTESARTGCVTIMTIHAAKGREFPVVILDGLSDQENSNPQHTAGFSPDRTRIDFKVGGCETSGYADWLDSEKQARTAELARLFYVGATRAKKMLFVPIIPRLTTKAVTSELTGEEIRVAYSNSKGATLFRYLQEHDSLARCACDISLPEPLDLDEAARQPFPEDVYERIDAANSTIATVTAAAPRRRGVTSLVHGEDTTLEPLAGFAELPSLPGANRPEHGTDYGTALHLAMERISVAEVDKDLQASIAAAIADTAVALNPKQHEALTQDVRMLLMDPHVRAALKAPNHRELPVLGTLADGTVVDGVIDLLYRESDGWVIADYKTDAGVSDRTRLEYFHQLKTYADLISRTLGEPVKRLELLFLREQHVQIQTLSV